MNTVLKHTNAERSVIAMLQDAGRRGSHALGEIMANGLPHRRIEAWHYTDLRNLLKDYPGPGEITSDDAKTALAAIPSQFACIELPIVDGSYYPGLATTLAQKILLASRSPSIDGSKVFWT